MIGGDDAFSINALKKIYLNWINEDRIITTNPYKNSLIQIICEFLGVMESNGSRRLNKPRHFSGHEENCFFF